MLQPPQHRATVQLQQPQPQLTEQQQWAMQNAARQEWMRNQFQASVRGMDPTSPGSMVGSGGGLAATGGSLHRAGATSTPATGLGGAMASYVSGPIGAGMAGYQALQSGAGLGDLSSMAQQLPERYQEHAWNQVGKATADQAFSGALRSGASGAGAGMSIGGPVGAGVGAGVGAITGYLSAMRRGMSTPQGRQATIGAMTPQGGQNWGRFAAHSPGATFDAAQAARNPGSMMSMGNAANSGGGSYLHKRLLKKLL